MKNTDRKTVSYQIPVLEWLENVQKRESFNSFSQTVNWALYKAMKAEKEALDDPVVNPVKS